MAAAVAGAANLLVELTEMESFKSSVDTLLQDFASSDAHHGKVAEDRLDKASLGGPGFQEAEFLYASYHVVHQELQNLSKTLGLQIESMKLAIQASQTGYQNIDDDIKAQMQALNTQIAARYDERRDPNAAVNQQPKATPPQSSEGSVDLS
ncbi:hypothetical protein ACFVIM_07925 [Streptomyces sp. NPDC057638]|uniref:hypothetical protein n=1 Tax=Streptomyces sp. NPDC057638 TaxID=3346190 RepID=UPI003687D789